MPAVREWPLFGPVVQNLPRLCGTLRGVTGRFRGIQAALEGCRNLLCECGGFRIRFGDRFGGLGRLGVFYRDRFGGRSGPGVFLSHRLGGVRYLLGRVHRVFGGVCCGSERCGNPFIGFPAIVGQLDQFVCWSQRRTRQLWLPNLLSGSTPLQARFARARCRNLRLLLWPR